MHLLAKAASQHSGSNAVVITSTPSSSLRAKTRIRNCTAFACDVMGMMGGLQGV